MLIMPTTTTDFQALADGIVDDFFRNDVALTDGIAKVAVDREFTPEEVTRLTEKTNTAASLYFLKTAEDKKGSFKLAELEDVLRRTHADDEPGNGDTPAGQEKTAESGRNEVSFAVYTGLPRREAPRFDFAACFHSRQEKMAMELTVQDGIDFLASEFHVWNGPDFGKFAADSLAAYGDVAMPVLEGLAAYLHIPGDEIQKTAADTHQDYVDDTTLHMKVMEGICDGMSRIVKLSGEIGHLEQSLQDRWKEAKEGIK